MAATYTLSGGGQQPGEDAPLECGGQTVDWIRSRRYLPRVKHSQFQFEFACESEIQIPGSWRFRLPHPALELWSCPTHFRIATEPLSQEPWRGFRKLLRPRIMSVDLQLV